MVTILHHYQQDLRVFSYTRKYLVLLVFLIYHSSRYYYYCGFNFHSVMANIVLICHLHVFLDEMMVHVFCPFSNWILKFFSIWFWAFFVNYRYKLSIIFMVCKHFLPIYILSFHPPIKSFLQSKHFKFW